MDKGVEIEAQDPERWISINIGAADTSKAIVEQI